MRGRVEGEWYFSPPLVVVGFCCVCFKWVLLVVPDCWEYVLGEAMLCRLLGGLPWSHLCACFLYARGVVFVVVMRNLGAILPVLLMSPTWGYVRCV